MACIAEEILDFSQGHGHYVGLDWLGEGYGLSAYRNWCGMGLDVLYKFFIISLNSTQPEIIMPNYVIHCLLNEDVHCDNQEVGKVKDETKPEKDKENVVLAVILSPGNPCMCWRCGKMGHIEAFCKEKPICGSETREANVAFTATDDFNIWLGDYEV